MYNISTPDQSYQGSPGRLGYDQPVIKVISAPSRAFQMVDQQMQTLYYPNIGPWFPGAGQMANAQMTMRTAANGWPATKAAVVTAAQGVVATSGPVSMLADGTTNVAEIQEMVRGFAAGPLSALKFSFANAKNSFDNFTQNLDNAYSQSANANASALVYLTQNQIQTQAAVANYNQEINNLYSAGSVIMGIITLGATELEQIMQLRHQIQIVEQMQQNLQNEQQGYNMSLATLSNALNSTKTASLALLTLDTSIEQVLNSLNCIAAQTSSNLVVMQAELAQLKNEFAQAVQQASQLC
jgi:hypothetical protein